MEKERTKKNLKINNLEGLATLIQDDICLAMDGHEEVFDPKDLCDIVKHLFNEYKENIGMNEKWIEKKTINLFEVMDELEAIKKDFLTMADKIDKMEMHIKQLNWKINEHRKTN